LARVARAISPENMWGSSASSRPYMEGAEALENIILATDSYKASHYRQYPPGTEYVYSYFESRGGKFDEVCFFGLQYFIKRYLCGAVVTRKAIDEAKAILGMHMPPGNFNEEGWEYILKEHGGKLPVSIKAVPEGTVVPIKNVLFTMVNTDPKCYWLTNYLETLLVEVWYPMTVCTNSREQKKLLQASLHRTGGTEDGIDFMLHDFGYRGVSSVESAAIGGAAHLVNFKGTDTMAALICAKRYYKSEGAAGFSIPAAEHSTITSWGREGEADAFANLLEQYPDGLVAVVSDSYDVFHACSELWGRQLKEKVKARGMAKEGNRLIIRPDSGEPTEIVPQLLVRLGEAFAEDVTETSTGHRLLPPYLRVIQGDGISYESLADILKAVEVAGWATENVAFGSGGALLQKLDRDTQKCAFKCSEITKSGGDTVMVFKDPITDKGKQSKKGKLTLELDGGSLYTTTEGLGDPAKDQLVQVFRDGDLCIEWTFAEIRERAALKPYMTAAATAAAVVDPSGVKPEVLATQAVPAQANGGCCEIM